MNKINVYLENGSKRSFAGALEWPGWARSGKGESSALEALFAYAKRYADALGPLKGGFWIPDNTSAFSVIERLQGDSTTDFGAPNQAPAFDSESIDEAELQRYQDLLGALWNKFDEIVDKATGKELRKGPRGGGRDLEKIIKHVIGADSAYLGQIGWKYKAGQEDIPIKEMQRMRREILEALGKSARGEVPVMGPRGGIRWTPRYFVRRSAWHLLDHAWEIEDRIL